MITIPYQTLAIGESSEKECPPAVRRFLSVDIFRGLNILLMIFVNNLAEVKGLPWWMYHRGDVNGMTFVDMVFPGFLFLMGISIPLAMDARVARGQSKATIWAHVATRSLSLLVLGLFIANASHVDARYTHMSAGWWTVLGFVGIALGWMRYPGEEKRKSLYQAIRYSGFAMMAVLFVLFRKSTPEGQPGRLDFSYWEILGLLGWAYLLISTLYLLIGKRFKILVAVFAALVAINALSTLGWLNWMDTGPLRWNPFEAGLSSLTMAGVLAAFVIAGNTIARSFREKAQWILGAAAMLFVHWFCIAAARDFEEPRHANVVLVLHSRQSFDCLAAVLARGREGLEYLGKLCQASRREPIARLYFGLHSVPGAASALAERQWLMGIVGSAQIGAAHGACAAGHEVAAALWSNVEGVADSVWQVPVSPGQRNAITPHGRETPLATGGT